MDEFKAVKRSNQSGVRHLLIMRGARVLATAEARDYGRVSTPVAPEIVRDADEMVRRANTHTELLSALKLLLAESLDWQDVLGQGDRPSLDEAIRDAQAAIAKAVS